MKILLATYWDIPHVGGVWTYMVQLKEKLESLGHEVDLLGYGKESKIVHVANENRSIDKEKLLPFIKTVVNKDLFPEIYANQLVGYTEQQRYAYELGAAYLGLDKYDIVHAQDIVSSTSLKRVLPNDIPLVTTLHGCVAHEIRQQLNTIHRSSTSYLARPYYDHLEQTGATSAQKTIVANNWLKNILTDEFQVPAEQIEVYQYGYDVNGFLNRLETEGSKTPVTDKKSSCSPEGLPKLKVFTI